MDVWLVYLNDVVTVHDVSKLPEKTRLYGPTKFQHHPTYLALFAPEKLTYAELEDVDPVLKSIREEHRQEQFYDYKRDDDEKDMMCSGYLSQVDKRTGQLYLIATRGEDEAWKRRDESTINKCLVDGFICSKEWNVVGEFYIE